MAKIDPEEAACLTCGTWVGEPPSAPLTSFAIDTRTLRPGDTFVALRGADRDGHDFVNEARRQMAVAAIVEIPDEDAGLPQLVVDDSLEALQSLAGAWREQFTAPVIAVTGSYGKTTVKELLGNLMSSIWFRNQGNFNNHIGVPLSLLELDPAHHAGGILEAGINNPGEMAVLADLIQPDMAVITAVGPAHLERLGTLEEVAREKAVLAQAVCPGGNVWLPAGLLEYEAFREIPSPVSVHAVLEANDPAPAVAETMENIHFYRYHWYDTRSSRGMGVLETTPPMPPGRFSFRAGSPGMVSNLALVVHLALHLGVPNSTLQGRLDAWRPFRHRGEVVQRGKLSFYVDCYNANPGSMLDSARRFENLFADRPRLYVLGSMNELGDEAEHWHRETGRKLDLAEEAEVFLVGHGAKWMADGLREGGHPASAIHVVADLGEVRERLAEFSGAVFLKGSRTYALESLLQDGEGTAC